ncbi:hypothetical protein [Streptomyces parvus]|uniref:hypothetical protein n=1 Tax=Streptomyces parvus TaxID=66428 RepID=UPI003D71EDE8
MVAPPASRTVGTPAATAPAAATATRSVASRFGAPAPAAALCRTAGLGAAAVRAFLAVRLGRRFGR